MTLIFESAYTLSSKVETAMLIGWPTAFIAVECYSQYVVTTTSRTPRCMWCKEKRHCKCNGIYLIELFNYFVHPTFGHEWKQPTGGHSFKTPTPQAVDPNDVQFSPTNTILSLNQFDLLAIWSFWLHLVVITVAWEMCIQMSSTLNV